MSDIKNILLKKASLDSSFRRTLIANLLKESKEWASQEAMRSYLSKHPNADKTQHTVKQKGQGKQSPKPISDKGKYFDSSYGKGKSDKTKKIDGKDIDKTLSKQEYEQKKDQLDRYRRRDSGSDITRRKMEKTKDTEGKKVNRKKPKTWAKKPQSKW